MLIQNPDATAIIRDQAKLTLSEGFPNTLQSVVVPVIDMTPRNHRVTDLFQTRLTTGNIFTVDTKADTFITGVQLYGVKTVADTGTDAWIQVNVGGTARLLIFVAGTTTTAERMFDSYTFPQPLKLDKGTSPSLNSNGTFTYLRGQIFGYVVQPN